jgi:hypothetical protein
MMLYLMGNTNQPSDSLETWSDDDGVDAGKRSDGTSAVFSTSEGRKAKNKKDESANKKNKRAYAAVVDMLGYRSFHS